VISRSGVGIYTNCYTLTFTFTYDDVAIDNRRSSLGLVSLLIATIHCCAICTAALHNDLHPCTYHDVTVNSQCVNKISFWIRLHLVHKVLIHTHRVIFCCSASVSKLQMQNLTKTLCQLQPITRYNRLNRRFQMRCE